MSFHFLRSALMYMHLLFTYIVFGLILDVESFPDSDMGYVPIKSKTS